MNPHGIWYIITQSQIIAIDDEEVAEHIRTFLLLCFVSEEVYEAILFVPFLLVLLGNTESESVLIFFATQAL